MKRPHFSNGEYYHVYNRGVDKRNIFLDERDYSKFIYLLLTGNDTKAITYISSSELTEHISAREKIVDIICYCLMPNHFHLLLRQRIESGIPLFMKKISTGYAMYFNLKNERSGALLQGRYKAIHIDRHEYFTHLTRYIHLNPAEMVEPGFKENGIKKLLETHDYVKNYRWSSYHAYLNRNHKNQILDNKLICEIFETEDSYEKFVKEWMAKDLELISNYTID